MKNNTFKQTEIGEIPEDWSLKCVSELPFIIGDGNYSSKYPKTNELLDSGVPFISGKDLSDGRIRSDGLRYISSEQHSKLLKGHIKERDVLLVTRADVGVVGYVTKEFTGANINAQLVFLRADNEIINSEYLYYLLSTPRYKHLINTFSSGSAQSQLPIKALNKVPLIYPEINEQQQIVSILSSLDDKIELNRRMNKTLEEIGKALFKQWFVDFEFPNENGEPYKSSGGEMVESELGEIPKGWKVKKVKQVFEINTKSIKPSKNGNENYWHFSIPSFDQFNSPMLEQGNTIKSNKTHVSQNSILISKLNPKKAKRIWTVFTDRWNEKSISSTEFINVVPDNDDWTWSNFLFRENHFYTYFASLSTGSTGSRQRVRPTELKNLNILYPEVAVRQFFHKSASYLLLKIDENMHEIMTLTVLRDSLLPRLMSGKIRVN